MKNKKISLVVLVVALAALACMGGVANAITLTDSDAKITNYESDFGDGINDDNASPSGPYYHQIYSATSTVATAFAGCSGWGEKKEENTTYHFRVKSKDASCNGDVSGDYNFTATPLIPPTITDVGVVDISVEPFSSVTVHWESDVLATSQVEYGKTPDFGFNTTLDEELCFHHHVRIDNLELGMVYFFRVRSKNADEEEMISEVYTFATFRSEEITVNFTNSTYKNVTEKPTGWFETGQDADIVLGLNDFSKASPTIFNHPMKIATDGERLILADAWNNRVLIWNSIPTEINQPPDLVIGQKNLNSSEPGLAADKLNWPAGVATDGQRLLVADTENDRVLIWNGFPTENGEPADLVLGAPNFTTMGTGIGVGSEEIKKVFEWPWDVFTDGTRVMVTSTVGGRVLIWNEFPTENFQSADVVLTEEVGLGTPRCVYFDGQHLLVGDYNAERTFVWNELPKSDDEPYNFTLWQESDEFAWAISVVDGKLLALSGNHMPIWNEFPTNETDAPDILLGKVDFGGAPNRPTAASFEASHGGMVATTDHLFISGFNQNRVLIYNAIPTSNITLADVVLGAPDFETNTLKENYADLEGSAPCSDGEHLFVGSDFGRRLFVYKKLPNESLAKPDIVYDNLPASGVTVYENKLIIAAREDAKVYIWSNLPLSGEMPDIELGPEFDDGTKLMQPWGIAADENYLFVSDKEQNKIFVWEGGVPNTTRDPDFYIDIEAPYQMPYQLSSDGVHLAAVIVEGLAILLWNLPLDKEDLSPDVEVGVEWSGGPNKGLVFNLPQGVFIDGEHLFVGDTGYHRVLIWNKIPTSNETPPDIVLGQEDFELLDPHTTRDGLFCPGTLSFDGSYLWVGEFKFSNRLVRFPVLSATNNAPYDPNSPSPANGATDVSINTDLSWTGGDPDAGDTITYGVYFGTSGAPPLVSDDQTATTYDPGTLNNNTKYYWQIVAADNHGATTEGPVWDFTTVSPPSDEDNPDVATGLASLGDKLVVAYGYKAGEGGWTWYNPSWPPGANTLTTLYVGRGYWLNVSEACNLVYGTNTYALDADWNLIAWLGW